MLNVAPATCAALMLPVLLQVEPAVLLLVSTRGPSRNFVPAPLIASTPPALTVVVPAPIIVPPLQFSVPFAVRFSPPPSVPLPDRANAPLVVSVPEPFNVPPESA